MNVDKIEQTRKSFSVAVFDYLNNQKFDIEKDLAILTTLLKIDENMSDLIKYIIKQKK